MRRNNWRSERGAVAVEFALVGSLLLLLLLMGFEVGLMVEAQLILSGAAREGGRQAAVDGGWSTQVEGVMEQYLTSGRLVYGEATVEVQPHQAAYGRPVRVRLSYPYQPRSGMLRALVGSEVALTAEVVSRSERLEARP